MGLFTPKMPERELLVVKTALSQCQDCTVLINNTIKPDVFFKRLNFLLDLLLRLQKYEKYKIFKGSSPTTDYKRVLRNLENTVDNFLERSFAALVVKTNSLKTTKAKISNAEKYIVSIIVAFEMANTFWSGSRGFPHYTGPLFTSANQRKVDALDKKVSEYFAQVEANSANSKRTHK